MKRILPWSLAAFAALAFSTTPLEAAPKKQGKGGGGKRPAAAAVKRAPNAVAKAPKMKARAPKQIARSSVPKQRSAVARASKARPNVQRQQIARAQTQRPAVVAQQRKNARTQQQLNTARAQQRTAFAQQRTAQQLRQTAIAQQRRSPSVAFGGTSTRSVNRVYNDARRYEYDVDNRNYYYNPPVTVYRDWDRGRIHSWNNHRYHWLNNAWVMLDVPTSLSYTTGYDTGYSYGSLESSVQAALDREGYDPGPVDGVIGSRTREAIADYQSDNGLYVTGTIDDALLSSLGLR